MFNWALNIPVNEIVSISSAHSKGIKDETDFPKTRFNALITFLRKKVNRSIIKIEYDALLVIEPFQH